MSYKGVCYFGPTGSGKTTLMGTMIIEGKSCFDTDFIYSMYYREMEGMDEGHKWSYVRNKFHMLFTPDDFAYDYIFTADTEIRDYLREYGWLIRNISVRKS